MPKSQHKGPSYSQLASAGLVQGTPVSKPKTLAGVREEGKDERMDRQHVSTTSCIGLATLTIMYK